MMSKSLAIGLSLVAATAALGVPAASGQASPQTAAATAPVPAPTTAPPLPSDYVIGPEDVLNVAVWKNDVLSRVVPVRPDGKISLPLLHDIHAAGLTPMQLRDKIAAALGEFLPSPEVSVTVNDVRSYRVSVLGEVTRPGVLQLKAHTSILEAIALVGGFKDFASPSKILIFRKDASGATHRIKFNYNRAVSGADDDNLMLKAGDVVVVP